MALSNSNITSNFTYELDNVKVDLPLNVCPALFTETSGKDNFLYDFQYVTHCILTTTEPLLTTLSSYVELDFTILAKWLILHPLLLTFLILPSVIILLIYITCLILFIYRWYYNRLATNLGKRLATSLEQHEFWMAGRLLCATMWDLHARFWHSYEVDGLDNIPTKGGAMCVYYHGAIPVDYYYLTNRLLLARGIMIHSVVDKFLYSLPGVRIILDAYCCTPGTVESITEVLKEGNIVGLAPGGVYEAQFGDNNYQVLWRQRLGFAKAAIAAGVPVVPVFTENVREAFRVISIGERFFHWMFIKTRLPMKPLYGGFPVKMVTHVGKQICIEEGMTPEQLRDKCKEAMEELIKIHQTKPGSILKAVLSRFNYKTKSA